MINYWYTNDYFTAFSEIVYFLNKRLKIDVLFKKKVYIAKDYYIYSHLFRFLSVIRRSLFVVY